MSAEKVQAGQTRMNAPTQEGAVPLVCDLDGTLTRTDTTHELLILFLKSHPFFGWFKVLMWVRIGRAHMKENLYAAVGDQLDTARLPYNQELLDTDVFQSAADKVLVSGAAQPIVTDVAKAVPEFGSAIGTDAGRNLTSKVKAAYLDDTYPDGFDYVGNSSDDLAVWEKARKSYAVNAPSSVIDAAKSRGIDLQVLVPRTSQSQPLRKAMRLHQWAKNGLIFVIPALNLSVLSFGAVFNLLAVFVAFGLVASATYLLNDLLDVQEDRKHHSKCNRPFANGTLDVVNGAAATAVLFVAGMVLGLFAGLEVAAMLVAYAAVSLSYSFYFKRVALLDAMMLAFLFCWRIITGGVAITADINVWFMTAVGAFFLSLAFGKRCIELERKAASGSGDTVLHGRGYQAQDYPVVLGLGLVTGMAAPLLVLVYVYLSGSSVVDHTASALTLAALLCFWISRFWVLVNRGQVQDDPVVFALKDRHSLVVLSCMIVILVVEQVL